MKLNFRKIRLFGYCCLLAATAVFSEEKVPRMGLIFEGSFVEPEVTTELMGARKTKMTAAYKSLLGIKLFKKREWEQAGWTWELFLTEASKVADRLAEEMKPNYVRDQREVIEYAIVKSDNPFLSSVITSADFVKPFEETLGKKLHVLILDRNVIYVFPASGGNLGEYAEAIRQTFKSTPLPVSLEIFEVTKTGFRVIGEIEQPVKTQIRELKK